MNNLINILKRKDVLLLIFVLVLGLLGFLDGMWLAHTPRSSPLDYYPQDSGASNAADVLSVVLVVMDLAILWMIVRSFFKRRWLATSIYIGVMLVAGILGQSYVYGEAYAYSTTPSLCHSTDIGSIVLMCGDVDGLGRNGTLMYDPSDEMQHPVRQWPDKFRLMAESTYSETKKTTVSHSPDSECSFYNIQRLFGHVYWLDNGCGMVN